MSAHPGTVQVIWVLAVGALTFAGLLWTLYRMRLRHIAREFERALEARIAERTRIARELHDTLLGSFNALLLHLEAASILFQTQPSEAKRTLDNTIAQAARAIDQGREAVQGLRSPVTQSDDLVTAIGRLAAEISQSRARLEPGAGSEPERSAFRVVVEGAIRHLHPMVMDEVYRIAAEALRNAFQHSHATQIEVELHYHHRRFSLRIRDDGRGVDAQTLASRGREGHFGLKGMHERADLAGGKLAVWSARGVGTELELTIPGARAYSGTRRG
jgi:signal transduction histidine kinase